MKPFDSINTPLQGYHIIEASAGTGKTHAIADLFLRLILEKKLSISEILVVTFTEAATEELRDRIRKRIKKTFDALTAAQDPDGNDGLLKHLIAEYRGNQHMITSLRTALQDFDEAAIHTIHGFCQRMLRDKPFESNSLFDTELITDQSGLLQEVVDDFWRRNFYTAAPQFLQYAIQEKCNPEMFLQLISRRSIDPELAVIPVFDRPDIERAQHALQAAYEQLRSSWQTARSEVESILLTSTALSRTRYRPDSTAALFPEMDHYLDSGLLFPPCKNLEKFTASYIAAAVRKGCAPPQQRFFDECETFAALHSEAADVFARHLLFLKRTLLEQVDDELKKKKHEYNIRSFDDLLKDMHRALTRGDGSLAKAIRKKYRAALIDEFQDTDPVQYDIFKIIFDSGDHSLFMIGDPKQAIYSFRGADIYTYMKASASVKADLDFTLITNWRSDAGLITATNTIFSRAREPFVFKQIQFCEITPADNNKQEPLLLPGPVEPPLHIWFIDQQYADSKNDIITRGAAEPLIARAVAAEIMRLCVLGQQGAAQLGSRALCPGDIAVLVRKNKQARLVQEELKRVAIPSVLYGAESIYRSREAEEVERVITAVAEPGYETKIKAALATDMCGLSGNDLQALAADEAAWETRLVRFHQYHEQWAQHGFIRMFRQLLQEEGVRRRLLAYRDGERRMTNLLHCAEVLHRAETEKALGMEGLISWFGEKLSDENATEEDQIRLETDENAVKLITIHRSKGLEYPVVFCPFAWDSATIKGDQFSFHDPAEDYRLTLDLGTGLEANRIHAATEELAENVRLLYVALTRAKNRCYLVWGKINGAETAAPAYLFHQPETFSSENIVAELGHRVRGLSYDEMRGEVVALQKSTSSITVSSLPVISQEPYAPPEASADVLGCRQFAGAIEQDWRIASYSSLIAAAGYRAEGPDYDRVYDLNAVQQTFSDNADISNFPRGAQAGSCIHEIFEQVDFSLADAAPARQIIADKLGRYGFEMRWQDTLWKMVQQVLSMPLERDQRNFMLKNISAQERRHELEFYFPLERITSAGFAHIFSCAGMFSKADDFAQRMQQLEFSPVRGFMRGFIDMVFRCEDKYFLLDWKSNYLGNSPEDYAQGALRKEMVNHYYILQYHLYAVALHRYLALRRPAYQYERHFGGVYYIFIRGIDSAHGPEYGIYRDRPAENLVTALSDYLDGSMEIQQHG
jgi:exodeoxyribonuclease V beta subunit